MEVNKAMLNEQRTYFESGITKNLEFRKRKLLDLKNTIKKYEVEVLYALKQDLGKAPFEAYETEIGMVQAEISYMLKNLTKLARPKSASTTLANFPSTGKIYKEPYGIVLIISPWNYPFQLALEPLVGAITAGNCAVVKPSNYSPNTSRIVKKILEETFDRGHVLTMEGGRDANRSLLEQKFDYIFFTGGKSVGRTVMEAASRNLTPVTLELGGKSPCIVDETANISMTARRIVWGKFLNCGQTCVAPDYVLVHSKVRDKLVFELIKYVEAFYGKKPLENKDYPKIINEKHYNRLKGLIEGQDIIYGGCFDDDRLKLVPTFLNNPTLYSKVMQEEIFGPILPIIEYKNIETVKEMINGMGKPLALYLFTNSRTRERYIIKNIAFGGGCINDTIVHLATPNMPFGGVGESGMGSYHGKASFNTFTHEKSILKKSNLIDIPLRYPPFGDNMTLLKKILK